MYSRTLGSAGSISSSSTLTFLHSDSHGTGNSVSEMMLEKAVMRVCAARASAIPAPRKRWTADRTGTDGHVCAGDAVRGMPGN